MKPAFSTVAVPDWSFARLAERAAPWGYLGCELRTFSEPADQFVCEPLLTAAAKVRTSLDGAGLKVVSLGTSIRFDEPVTPPVIGHVFADKEHALRETKGMTDLAIQLECPFVRVFGFEIAGGERRASALGRIVERLTSAVAYARNSGVRIMLENGGSFATSADLAAVLDAVDNPLLAAAYSVPVGLAAGERPDAAVNVLGERLVCVKLKDFRGGVPCALGEGEIDNRSAVEAIGRAGYLGWIVYEHDRAWFRMKPAVDAAMADAERTLAASAKTLYQWMGGVASSGPRARVAPVS